MKRATISALALCLCFAIPAKADDGLYQDVFAPNSSFVRVVAPGQTVANIAGKSVSPIENGVSDYVNVMPGEINLDLPSGKVTFEAGPSAHYTIIMMADGSSQVVTDGITNSPAKADISLYNLTDTAALTLYVPAAKAAAIESIAPLQSQTVAIKAPLTLDFELRSGDEVLATVAQVDLVRGSGVSIVLMETDGKFSATAVSNSYFK